MAYTMTARTQLMFAMGSKPAIMMPAPNAIPATGAVVAPAMPVVVGMRETPTKLAAEVTTSKTPMTHMRIFRARGFHLATTCLPPFSTAGGFDFAERRPFRCNLYADCAQLATSF